MRRTAAFVLIAGLMWPVAPTYARDVLRLQPSTRWVLEYADESCRLARNFGEGKDRITLMFDQFQPGDAFKIRVAGKPVGVNRMARVDDARLRFGPNEAEFEITAETARTTGGEPVLLVNGTHRLAAPTEEEKAAAKQRIREGRGFEPAPLGPVREAAATWLQLRKVARADLVLETGPMDKPLAALRECSWDTVRSWGLNVEQQKRLIRKAHPKRGPQTWFNSSDYPMSMVRGGYEGIVNFRLLLDQTGKPTDCKIQMSTRPKEFDEVVCRAVMKRAEFEPALDAQGRPVPSYWLATVNFRLCC